MSCGHAPRSSTAVAGAAASKSTDPVAVVCGGGSLPATVADALVGQGRGVVMFPLHGWADPAAVERFRHHWIHIGQLGRFSRLARSEGCRDLVLIGTLVRPTIRQLRLDIETLRVMPRIIRAYRGGDDHLLSGIGRILEDYGFRLVGAHEVAPQILAPLGHVGRFAPTPRDEADITRGLALLAATGPFDVGQAAVVADGRVLAVEAAEGTDHMLAHIAEMRRGGRIRSAAGTGVLVKAPKPSQDRRFDLPTVGPSTVEHIAAAGLAGLAVVAGGVIIVEPARVMALADKANIFVAGVRDGGPVS
ncbi:MAG: UDP-2,3-diacylglucosamine diphosphatase LpxI [Xanthobacteraceae bacterium]